MSTPVSDRCIPSVDFSRLEVTEAQKGGLDVYKSTG